jgi:hypothetical protein
VLASDVPLLDVFWSLLMFVGLALLVVLVIVCLADNLRREDHSGWAKAGWTVFLVVLPIVGVLVYVATRPAGAAASQTPRSDGRQGADGSVAVEYVSVDYLVVETDARSAE